MRMLIVEDEVKMAGLIRRGLLEEGHAADVAASGEEAILSTMRRTLLVERRPFG